ncbi:MULTISPECIES: hypothetical protein [Xenorhabdus]|uniref:hypothetical protein n=1 Tax=Xenorhabdus TaxID=626 RepID=UPI000B03DFAC|nr:MULTISPECIES: hypothetical protein [Xenorhabdus]
MEKRIEELEKKVERLEKQLTEFQGAVDCYFAANQKTIDICGKNLLITTAVGDR